MSLRFPPGRLSFAVGKSISFFVSIYLEAYCTVFPFNSILIYDFIRRAGIYSVCPDVSSEWQKRGKKEKRENETGERSFQQESFSATARAEIGVTVAPWPTSFFRVRRMDRKRENCGEGNEVGETTSSFVITVQCYIFYALR